MDAKKYFSQKYGTSSVGQWLSLVELRTTLMPKPGQKAHGALRSKRSKPCNGDALWAVYVCIWGDGPCLCLTLEGKTQAKFAMVNGGVMIAFFLVMFVMLPTSGYSMPGVVWLIPPFIFLGGLIASGYLHSMEEETAPAEG